MNVANLIEQQRIYSTIPSKFAYAAVLHRLIDALTTIGRMAGKR